MPHAAKDFFAPYREDPNLLGLLVRFRILNTHSDEDKRFISTLLSRLRRKQRYDGSVDGSVVGTCQILRRFSGLGVSPDKPGVESAIKWLRSIVASGARLVPGPRKSVRLEGGFIPVPLEERDKYVKKETKFYQYDTLGGNWPDVRAAFANGLGFLGLELEALFRYKVSPEDSDIAPVNERIMSMQLDDGSWPAPGAGGRVASTVMVLRALSGKESLVKLGAAASALEFLSAHQAQSGHFVVRRTPGGPKKRLSRVAEAYIVETVSRFPGELAKEIVRKLSGSLLNERRSDGTWGRGPDRWLPTWRIVSAFARTGIVTP